MRIKTICAHCGSNDIEYIGNDKCFCFTCKEERETKDVNIETPYERCHNSVHATGNKWAIENFNATH